MCASGGEGIAFSRSSAGCCRRGTPASVSSSAAENALGCPCSRSWPSQACARHLNIRNFNFEFEKVSEVYQFHHKVISCQVLLVSSHFTTRTKAMPKQDSMVTLLCAPLLAAHIKLCLLIASVYSGHEWERAECMT